MGAERCLEASLKQVYDEWLKQHPGRGGADLEQLVARMGAVTMTVVGRPQQKGSFRSFPSRNPGHAGKMVFVPDNPRSKSYQKEISRAARDAGLDGKDEREVLLDVHFVMPRPKKHFARGRLRADAPFRAKGKPDIDKLLRAVLDGLTGAAYKDDSQVVVVYADKTYGSGDGRTVIAVRYRAGEGGE